jgi:hypothetical protein
MAYGTAISSKAARAGNNREYRFITPDRGCHARGITCAQTAP